MDEQTLDALKGSIAKWEAIVAGTGEDLGAENCPLCALFLRNSKDRSNDCKRCPVKIKTGLRYCKNTPYIKYFASGSKTDAKLNWTF